MLKDDIRKVKDQGKLFDRLSSDYDMGKVYNYQKSYYVLFSYFSLTKKC